MSLRIQNTNQAKSINIETPSSSGKKAADFSNILSQTRHLQSQELEIFLKRLEQQGQKLSESLSIQDLLEFKTMVKSFLKSTLGKSRSLQEETVWDYSGQPKVMSRVNKIDRLLEELGESMLSSQAQPLKILAKIDEIRGLIIDLFA